VDIGTLDKFELRLTCAAPGAQVTAPNDDGTRHASRRRRGSAYGRGYAGNLRIPNIFPAQPSAGRPADVVDPWATP
jgi:hypothetical protein